MTVTEMIRSAVGMAVPVSARKENWWPDDFDTQFRSGRDLRSEEAEELRTSLRAELVSRKRGEAFFALESRLGRSTHRNVSGLTLSVPLCRTRDGNLNPHAWDAEQLGLLPLSQALDLLLDDAANPELELARRKREVVERERKAEKQRRDERKAREEAAAEAERQAIRLEKWASRSRIERAVLQLAAANPKQPIFAQLATAIAAEPDEPVSVPNGMELE